MAVKSLMGEMRAADSRHARLDFSLCPRLDAGAFWVHCSTLRRDMAFAMPSDAHTANARNTILVQEALKSFWAASDEAEDHLENWALTKVTSKQKKASRILRARDTPWLLQLPPDVLDLCVHHVCAGEW